MNIIVKDLDVAFAPLRESAQLNCRRLDHRTPCAESGHCEGYMIP